MKKLIILVIIAVMMTVATSTAGAGTSDKELAQEWARDHCKGAKVEKVVTIAKGGYKGKAGKWSVKYPRKVKKGKKVTVYMVTKGGDVKAMVCMGKIK